MEEGRVEIPWSVMASILVLARFCAPSPELQIAEAWYEKTALDDLLGVPGEKINDDRLYRALDALLPHQDALCKHLQQRYGELFGSTFDFFFYDITSTYFEGTAKGNPQAKRGYSRDSRPDCPQVCIGLVATKEGLPIAFEIFDGNRTDVTTAQEMAEPMETKYGKANRVWVLDRGMVSEDNLEFMRSAKARYLVGTPKSLLKKFERQLLEHTWEEVQPGVEVRLCSSPEGVDETFVLCRSVGRKEKENAILNRFVTRLEDKLMKLTERANTGKIKEKQKVERQVGRLLERNSRAASLFTVTVTEKEKHLSIDIRKNNERYGWALETGGSYILRTNWKETDPKLLWNTYIQLTEVEDAFRTTKHDLGMRPIFHQKNKEDSRTHPRLFSLPGVMANPPAMDICIGVGDCTEKVTGRDEGDQIRGRPFTGKGQNHQVEDCGYCPTRPQSAALKDENPPPQQAKSSYKCNGEKHLYLNVTICNSSF